VRLILSSKNLNENTGLIHLAGIELAPFAQPDTMPKLLDALSLGNNFFFREWWLNKRQERYVVDSLMRSLSLIDASWMNAR
jgi:hypothetical protein